MLDVVINKSIWPRTMPNKAEPQLVPFLTPDQEAKYHRNKKIGHRCYFVVSLKGLRCSADATLTEFAVFVH